MIRHSSPPVSTRLLAALAMIALSATALWAEDAYVTGWLGTLFNVCPPSCPINIGTHSQASIFSAACPVSRDHSVYSTTTTASWVVTPTLTNSAGVYKIFVTKGTSTSCPADLMVSMTTTGGALADANGVPQMTVPTTAFASTNSVNTWTLVGYLANNTNKPAVTFAYASGGCSRWYMDAVYFQSVQTGGIAPVTNLSVAASDGNLRITYSGGAASQFVLLGTNTLHSSYSAVDSANWQVVATTNGTTPATFTVPLDTSPGARMFYRIKSQ